MATLLEKALAVKTKRRMKNSITDEEIELSLAWLADKVTGTQASKAMGHSNTARFHSRIAVVVREAYRRGFIAVRG
jgi:hypothetical protein